MKDVRVGLLGLGTIGSGVADLILNHAEEIGRKAGVRLHLAAVADLDRETPRENIDVAALPWASAEEVIEGDLDVVVELVGGTTIAREFVLRVLANGRPVVTANKALLAEHGPEIFAAARASGAPLLFEAAVGGAIPIIVSLRESFIAGGVHSVYGIVNGTCNYILTEMSERGVSYEDVLAEAQRLGYAEADPSLDVSGGDAAHKLALLASLAFGADFDHGAIHVEGVEGLSAFETAFAAELGYAIKLLAITRMVDGELELRVHPALISSEHPLASVHDAYNAIYVEGDAVGQSMLYGRGAGRLPTASAVVGDVIAVARGVADAGGLRILPGAGEEIPVRPIDDLRCRFYLRFTCLDRPGVLARITGELGERGVSISSVMQQADEDADGVPVVLMTHEAREADLRAAIAACDGLEAVTAPTVVLRVVDP